MLVIFTSVIFFMAALTDLTEAEASRDESDYRLPLYKNSIGRPDDALSDSRFLRELEALRMAALNPRQGRSSHTLDSLSGMSFGTSKRLDTLSGMGFGAPKRNFDEIDRSGFNSFIKRNFDEIDRSGFNSFVKKNFDEIDRSGFNSFVKRSAPNNNDETSINKH